MAMKRRGVVLAERDDIDQMKFKKSRMDEGSKAQGGFKIDGSSKISEGSEIKVSSKMDISSKIDAGFKIDEGSKIDKSKNIDERFILFEDSRNEGVKMDEFSMRDEFQKKKLDEYGKMNEVDHMALDFKYDVDLASFMDENDDKELAEQILYLLKYMSIK